jgi:hypothetical protein
MFVLSLIAVFNWYSCFQLCKSGRLLIIDWLLRWGEAAVSELWPWAYCSIPGWEQYGPGRRDWLRLTPYLSTRTIWPSPETSLEQVEDGQRKWEFSIAIPVGLQEFFYRPLALFPIRKEGVLQIFIIHKNPSPWLGLNPQPLGPVASTLTTTPPRHRAKVVTKFPSHLHEGICQNAYHIWTLWWKW